MPVCPVECSVFWNHREICHISLGCGASQSQRQDDDAARETIVSQTSDWDEIITRLYGLPRHTSLLNSIVPSFPVDTAGASFGTRHQSASSTAIVSDSSSIDDPPPKSDVEYARGSCATTDMDYTCRCTLDEQPPCEWCGSCFACPCAKALALQFRTATLDKSCLRGEKPNVHLDVEGSTARSTTVDSLSDRGVDCVELTSDDSEVEGESSLPTRIVEVLDAAMPIDLSGYWALNRVEGDMEALMLDAGVSWTLRKMAHSMNYGKGYVFVKIQQTADRCVFDFHNGPHHYRSEFTVGAGKQDTLQEDGSKVIIEPVWGNGCLVIDGTQNNGGVFQCTRRYLVDAELVCETTMSSGGIVKRYFQTRH